MGKKGKGTKKEEKPKKEPLSSRDRLKEALEATNVTTSSASAPRTSSSKKSERSSSVVTKIGCTESFRWDNSEATPVLPPMPTTVHVGGQEGLRMFPLPHMMMKRSAPILYNNILRHGWNKYFSWRCATNALTKSAMTSKTLKDGLSAPLVIAFMVLVWIHAEAKAKGSSRMDAAENGNPLHIVVIGATAVNEEKILRETNYWDELSNFFSGRELHLYLTGPEMSGKDGVFHSKPGREEGQADGPRMRVECWKANGVDFFLQKGRLATFRKEDTVVVGLNCGFGMAGHHIIKNQSPKQALPSNEVLWKWIPTLYFFAALDLPLMITASSLADATTARSMLQYVVGTYELVRITLSPVPFQSTVPGDQVVQANSHCILVRGQRPGFNFSVQALPDTDPRTEILRKALTNNDPKDSFPLHASVRKAGSHNDTREQAGSELVPLKKYGNYPPEKVTSIDDDGATDTHVPAPGTRAGEGPMKVNLKYKFLRMSDGASDTLEMTLQDVFMTEPAQARLGARRRSVVLYYYDCQKFCDVVFEAALPDEVDHTKTKIVFRRSDCSAKVVFRLKESDK
ncbi:unnamed protein product [Ectocarpus sp. 6 AP-2014]